MLAIVEIGVYNEKKINIRNAKSHKTWLKK